MSTFTIKVEKTVTYETTVTVEADDEEQACDQVIDDLDSGALVVDWGIEESTVYDILEVDDED